MVLMMPGVGFHDAQWAVQRLFSEVLGGGMASRLFQEAREKRGLAYAVDAYGEMYSDAGVLGIYAGTAPPRTPRPWPGSPRSETLKLAEAVEPAELARAKAQAKSGLAMGREAPLGPRRTERRPCALVRPSHPHRRADRRRGGGGFAAAFAAYGRDRRLLRSSRPPPSWDSKRAAGSGRRHLRRGAGAGLELPWRESLPAALKKNGMAISRRGLTAARLSARRLVRVRTVGGGGRPAIVFGRSGGSGSARASRSAAISAGLIRWPVNTSLCWLPQVVLIRAASGASLPRRTGLTHGAASASVAKGIWRCRRSSARRRPR